MFRKKYVKSQSRATAKHKFHTLVFNRANQKFIDFLYELQKLAKDAIGVAAQAITEQFIHAKRLPHLKKSINQDNLENGPFEQVFSHLGRELELNGLEAPDEKQIHIVRQQASKPTPEKPKPTCHHCKKPGHYRSPCRQLKKERDQNHTNKNIAGNNNISNNNSGRINFNTLNSKTVNNGNAKNANNRNDWKPWAVYPPCETCGKTNHSKEKCYFGANAANRPPPQNRRPVEQSQNQQKDTQISTIESVQAAALVFNWERHVFIPELHVTDRRRTKRQDFHQFLRFSSSNPQRHLSMTTN